MNDFAKELGKRIQLLRKAHGYSQAELAEKLKYESGKSIISKIESGKTEPPASKLQDFAKALGTNVAYLMGWGNDFKDLTQDEFDFILIYRNATDYGKGIAVGDLRNNQKNTSSDQLSLREA